MQSQLVCQPFCLSREPGGYKGQMRQRLQIILEVCSNLRLHSSQKRAGKRKHFH